MKAESSLSARAMSGDEIPYYRISKTYDMSLIQAEVCPVLLQKVASATTGRLISEVVGMINWEVLRQLSYVFRANGLTPTD